MLMWLQTGDLILQNHTASLAIISLCNFTELNENGRGQMTQCISTCAPTRQTWSTRSYPRFCIFLFFIWIESFGTNLTGRRKREIVTQMLFHKSARQTVSQLLPSVSSPIVHFSLSSDWISWRAMPKTGTGFILLISVIWTQSKNQGEEHVRARVPKRYRF